MKWAIQCIAATHPEQTRPSFMLQFDHKRYLFNSGEATGRLMNEYKVKAVKIKDVFVSRCTWDCLGGLPGLLLTLHDAAVAEKAVAKAKRNVSKEQKRQMLTIHGPPLLTRCLNATRHYMGRPGMNLQTFEFGEESCPTPWQMQDEHISVEAIPLYSSGTPPPSLHQDLELEKQLLHHNFVSPLGETLKRKRRPEEDGDRPVSHGHRKSSYHVSHSTAGLADTKRPVSEMTQKALDAFLCQSKAQTEWPRSFADGNDKQPTPPVALTYYIKGPTKAGKFNAEMATKLGVFRQDRSRLVRGETVTLADGRTVSPKDVIGDEEPGAQILLVDLPSSAYLPSLQASTRLNALYEDAALKVVIYSLGAGLKEHPVLQAFMERFGENVLQYITAPDVPSERYHFRKAVSMHERLHMIDPTIFRRLRPLAANSPSITNDTKPLWRPLQPGWTLDLAPEVTESLASFDLLETRPPSARFLSETRHCQNTILQEENKRKTNSKLSSPMEDVRVTPLGTGAMMASRSRNVSSTMLQFENQDIYLLDCGEGTAHQLALLSENNAAQQHLYQHLKFIYISHMHADHHLGVCQVLQTWQRLRTPDAHLYVAGPRRMLAWLEEYSTIQPGLMEQVRFLHNDVLLSGEQRNVPPPTKQMLEEREKDFAALGLRGMTNVYANHCYKSYSLIVDHAKAGRIVYSGDTRPNARLIKYGMQPRLLIHEATFEDELVEEAKEKRHSTISEALTVAREIKAEHVLLTHFSQRYLDTGGLNQEITRSTSAASDALNDYARMTTPPSSPPQRPRRSPSPSIASSTPTSTSTTKKNIVPVMASDLMTIRLSEFWRMQYYSKAMHFAQDDMSYLENDTI